jgi:aminopeptidase-like protein
MANDNASSLAVATLLARRLFDGPTPRHTVRFLFAPGTIGAIAWLDRNHAHLGRIRHGLVLANLGDAGSFTYKRSRRGTLDAPLAVDRAAELALRDLGHDLDVRPFTPTGYDERQFGSPGFDLPVGRLTRTPHGEYPEYHTSGDDLALVRPESLAASLEALEAIVRTLDGDGLYRNAQPYGEPQLGRRGLYASLGGLPNGPEAQQAALWVLNLSDGRHSLLDVAEHSGLPFAAVRAAADRLLEADLLTDETSRSAAPVGDGATLSADDLVTGLPTG